MKQIQKQEHYITSQSNKSSNLYLYDASSTFVSAVIWYISYPYASKSPVFPLTLVPSYIDLSPYIIDDWYFWLGC